MTYILARNARLADMVARHLGVRRQSEYRVVRDSQGLHGLPHGTKIYVFWTRLCWSKHHRDFAEADYFTRAQWDALETAKSFGFEIIDVLEQDVFGE